MDVYVHDVDHDLECPLRPEFDYGAFGAAANQSLKVEVFLGSTVLASQIHCLVGPGNTDPTKTPFVRRSLGFVSRSIITHICFTDPTLSDGSEGSYGMLDAIAVAPR